MVCHDEYKIHRMEVRDEITDKGRRNLSRTVYHYKQNLRFM